MAGACAGHAHLEASPGRWRSRFPTQHSRRYLNNMGAHSFK
jgi:hypothetical protein